VGSITIRLAQQSDNDHIIDLAKRCFQEGELSIQVQRYPEFNTLHRRLDPQSWHYVVEDAGSIVGLVGVLHFEARVQGRLRRLAYVMDLRLDQAYRKTTTAYRLIQKTVQTLLQGDSDFVIGNFLKNNHHSLIFTRGRAGFPTPVPLGDNRVFNMIPVRSLKTDPRFVIDHPDENDLEALVALYQRYGQGFRMAPELTKEKLQHLLQQLDPFSLRDFYVARDQDGSIKAVTALWDEHQYKQYSLQSLNPVLHMVNGLLRVGGVFFPLPKPIRAHQPIHHAALVLYAHDTCPQALDTLFRHINNINLGKNYQIITLYAQQRDPLFSLVQSHVGISVFSEMYVFSKDPNMLDAFKNVDHLDWLDLILTV